MPKLTAAERARLPDSAFAYIDSRGRRRLPIHDEAHVRNALARFGRVSFESDAARERARKRLLRAAKRYGIVPVGFMDGQLRSERTLGRIEARSTSTDKLPTGAVTFLFTDIEDSTGLLGRLGNGYARVLEDVRDPTGAGDSFAGGFLGYLDMQGTNPDEAALRRAMAYGTVLASFNVEQFGTERVARLTEEEVGARYEELRAMTHFET
jgi:hypothetical protein